MLTVPEVGFDAPSLRNRVGFLARSVTETDGAGPRRAAMWTHSHQPESARWRVNPEVKHSVSARRDWLSSMMIDAVFPMPLRLLPIAVARIAGPTPHVLVCVNRSCFVGRGAGAPCDRRACAAPVS